MRNVQYSSPWNILESEQTLSDSHNTNEVAVMKLYKIANEKRPYISPTSPSTKC